MRADPVYIEPGFENPPPRRDLGNEPWRLRKQREMGMIGTAFQQDRKSKFYQRLGIISVSTFCNTLVLGIFLHTSAYAIELKSKYAIVMDHASKSVLVSLNPDERVGPASMAKMMTLEVIFHALKSGTLSLEQEYRVSEHAWRTGGAPSRTSTMFAELKSNVSVENLIRGAAIQSANDACIILAEGFVGSEAAFAELMNERAAAIGMKNSYFTNPTGLPDPAMYVTVGDLAKLASHLIDTYPDYFPIFSEPEFTWNKIRQFNKNPLVRRELGVEGVKTGYTEESGYGFALTANREGQRIVAVIHGLETKNDRESEAERLLDWAYDAFTPRLLFENREIVGEARVFGGAAPYVSLVGAGAISVLVPTGADEKIRAKVIYQGPVRAPVEKGQQVGIVEIWRDELRAQETPLYAAADIPVGGLTRRAIDGAQELLFGYW